MTILRTLALSLALLLPGTAFADSSDVIRAELRPGWRLPDGSHWAALHLVLEPGWKTYWRAPGDAGIPPEFDWRGTTGVSGVAVHWPAPHVFFQSGMRSVGYQNEVVLPLRVTLDGSGDARLRGVIDLGVCMDICLPQRVRVDVALPNATKPDPVIAAALADQPLSAQEAGVGAVRCTVSPEAKGLRLRAEIPAPSGRWQAVIETADPAVWVAEPETHRENATLVAEARMRHMSGGAFALDRSGIRITLLGDGTAIDIRGCKG
ncbi:protein-disulfide reductase DsbD domain-containing protein [Thetidibacter halocola]|uniref:Thiol:disulfide interchange protein DsbD N-terminal domain-containing protein n=1 Tax=Thetidibacter halocola TaxID=2827239 RepID=A0A8J7WFJ4_9RHOB|nr:protein-disulfide reductase DsbD domain-containing protein [Thetidibacter halocola]MBS0124761.1 hypothetical protein [Thetidibacter halocola]